MIRRLTGLALAVAALTAPLVAPAQVSVNIHVPGLVITAPPPPRHEPLPPLRGGHVWVPGHWAWGGNAHVWQAGTWRPERPGYAYAPGRWVQAQGGWRWVEGDWRSHQHRRHDRDRDDDHRHGRDRDDDHRHDRDRDDDHRHGRSRDHGRGDGDGYHCPPGQAK